jgi:hypothetical protein
VNDSGFRRPPYRAPNARDYSDEEGEPHGRRDYYRGRGGLAFGRRDGRPGAWRRSGWLEIHGIVVKKYRASLVVTKLVVAVIGREANYDLPPLPLVRFRGGGHRADTISTAKATIIGSSRTRVQNQSSEECARRDSLAP